MAVKVVDLADFAYRTITSQDSDFGIPYIAYYFRGAIGSLNNLLGTSFIIDPTTLEFSPDMSEEEKSIFLWLFEINYLSLKIKGALGASGIDSVLEVSDMGTSVRVASKTELAKTWIALRKEIKLQLDEAIRGYNGRDFHPVSVEGDDIFTSNNCGLRSSFTYNRINGANYPD